MLDKGKQTMESFKIEANVPIIEHRLERTAGHLASLGNRLATAAGHGAILAYAQVFDEMYHQNTRTELQEQFTA